MTSTVKDLYYKTFSWIDLADLIIDNWIKDPMSYKAIVCKNHTNREAFSDYLILIDKDKSYEFFFYKNLDEYKSFYLTTITNQCVCLSRLPFNHPDRCMKLKQIICAMEDYFKRPINELY